MLRTFASSVCLHPCALLVIIIFSVFLAICVRGICGRGGYLDGCTLLCTDVAHCRRSN